MNITKTLTVLGAVAAISTSASAASFFFGNDTGLNGSNATAARNAFNAFGGSGAPLVEDFESIADDTAANGLLLEFANGMGDVGASATLSISGGNLPDGTFPGDTVQNSGYNGSNATSGTNYLLTGIRSDNGGPAVRTMTLDFSQNITGFGFDLVDLGDFGSMIMIEMGNGDVIVKDIRDPNGDGSDVFTNNGNGMFFGFSGSSEIDSITLVFWDNGGTGDTFGFDNLTVFVVPVPPAAALAGLGLIGVAWQRRRMLKKG